MTTAGYIAENQKRRETLFAPYNPILGEGSPLERFAVEWMDGVTVRLPVAMLEDEIAGPILREASSKGVSVQSLAGEAWGEAERELLARRNKHDFEFWCATQAYIKDKEGAVVPFVLNRPQRIYLARLEAQRLKGLPVRQIVLKHRQWGCTTMSYTYIAWHQIELYTGHDAWFVGLDQDGARDVIERYDVIRQKVGLTLRNYGGSDKTKELVERGCYVAAGSVERPNAPSGRPAQFVHLFEVGKWPSNPSVSAEKVAQNMGAMLPDKPGTVKIIESTAQASTGTYFMDVCRRAQNGEISDDFLFVSWLDDPQYEKPLDADVRDFIDAWTDYDRFLWDLGATLEQIHWYAGQRRKPEYIDSWRLMEEFPTTAQEAFQHGGKRIFPAPYVQAARKSCREPLLVGDLVADAQAGPGALHNIRFEPNARGRLSVWRMPSDTHAGKLTPKRYRYHNRFAAASDIGGRWEGADYSVTAVLDRAPLLWNGLPEIVAEWRGHIDKDLFAWESARLAAWYDRAYWAIEVNSLREDNETNYEVSLSIMDQVMSVYPNLYLRSVVDTLTQKVTEKPGFLMNAQTKDAVITALNKALRETHEAIADGKETIEGYVERCYGACDEMDLYMLHEDGSMGATSRAERSSKTKKDDRCITRAILLWLHSQKMDPVRAVPLVQKRIERKPSFAAY